MKEKPQRTKIIYVDRNWINATFLSRYGFEGAEKDYSIVFCPIREAFSQDYRRYKFLLTDLSFGAMGIVIPECLGNRVASFAKGSNPDIVCILTSGISSTPRPEEVSLFAKVFRWSDLPNDIKAYKEIAHWIMDEGEKVSRAKKILSQRT